MFVNSIVFVELDQLLVKLTVKLLVKNSAEYGVIQGSRVLSYEGINSWTNIRPYGSAHSARHDKSLIPAVCSVIHMDSSLTWKWRTMSV